MSLKAWYPLVNGLYKNQGCSSGDSYTSPSFQADIGKLGTSTYSGGNITWSKQQTGNIFNNNSLSIAFWIYPRAADKGGLIFGIDGNPRRFALYQYNNGDSEEEGSTLHWSWDPEDSYVDTKRVGARLEKAMPIGTWTHICVTYQKGIGTIYINGIFKYKFDFVSNISDFSDRENIIVCNDARYLNDFRVYDHCLSIYEVKELAKGLCCHYSFDGWYPENEFESLIGTSIGTGGQVTQEGVNTFKLTSTTSSPPENSGLWLYWLKTPLPSNSYFAFSVEVFNASNSADIRIHTEGTLTFESSNYLEDSNHILCTDKYKWVTIYGVLKTGEQGGAQLMFYPNPYNKSFTDGYQLYRNIKLYKGTEYIPADITHNINDNSGFRNNSSSSNIKEYNSGNIGLKSVKLNGEDTFIALPQICKINPPFTYNVWAYMNNWSELTNRTILSCTESGGFGLYANSTDIIFEAYDTENPPTYRECTAAITDLTSGWHMFTFSLSAAINGKMSAYIDGKRISNEEVVVKNFSYSQHPNTIFLGAEAGSNATEPSQNYFNGRIDDFKLYGSCLSDDDVSVLYEAYKYGMIITDNNTSISKFFIEEDISNCLLTRNSSQFTGLSEIDYGVKYLELYVNGNTANAYNHITGLGIKTVSGENITLFDSTVSDNLELVPGVIFTGINGYQNNDDKDTCYFNCTDTITVILPSTLQINQIWMRRYYADSRCYYQQKILGSVDGTTKFTIYDSGNTDTYRSSSNQGIGLYTETASGKWFNVPERIEITDTLITKNGNLISREFREE